MNMIFMFSRIILLLLCVLKVSDSFIGIRNNRNILPSFFSCHDKTNSWGSTNLVPSSYNEVESLASKSLFEQLNNLTYSQCNLFAIDVLTPGLNPKLEQKAFLQQEILFELTLSLLPTLFSKYAEIQLMFPSVGDAAGFQKYCHQSQISFPDNNSIILSGLTLPSLSATVECIVFVNAKNNVGDPVIREIQKIYVSNMSKAFIFLNCDLSEKVASMRDRIERDKFRSLIKQTFYFRNLVEIIRPTLVPFETGVLMYTTTKNQWEIFAVNEDDIFGPGSLNRYIKYQAVFKRSPKDPTVYNPPRFVLAGRYESSGPPLREDIDSILSKAVYSAKRDAQVPTVTFNLLNKDKSVESVTSFDKAFEIIKDYANTRGEINKLQLRKSIIFLENFQKEKAIESIPSSDGSKTLSTMRMSALDVGEPFQPLDKMSFSDIITSSSPNADRQVMESSSLQELKRKSWKVIETLKFANGAIASASTDANIGELDFKSSAVVIPLLSEVWTFSLAISSAVTTTADSAGSPQILYDVKIDTQLGPFRINSRKSTWLVDSKTGSIIGNERVNEENEKIFLIKDDVFIFKKWNSAMLYSTYIILLRSH